MKTKKPVILVLTTIVILLLILILTTEVSVAQDIPKELSEINGELLEEGEMYGVCTGVTTLTEEDIEKNPKLAEFKDIPITCYELSSSDTLGILIQNSFDYVGNIFVAVKAVGDNNSIKGVETYRIDKTTNRLVRNLDISSLQGLEGVSHYVIYAWDSANNIIPLAINSEVINDL